MAASYSFSSTVMFGLAAWKASASVANSGVVARLQPARDTVTGPADSVEPPLSDVPPPPQPVRASETAAAMPRPIAIGCFMRTPWR